LQLTKANSQPKIAKEYVFANTERKIKKYENTTICIVHSYPAG